MACALACIGCAPEPPAIDAPSTDPNGFDFIVVGSGAGGGPLAARLARGGHRVLLMEAGEDVGGRLEYQVPVMHALSTEHPDMAWWYFVQHHADPAIDALDSKFTEEGILYPRGSALGGSTAVNALVTVLPSRSDWDRIATLTGDGSWRANRMDQYYDRVREWLSIEVPDPALAIDDEKVSGFLTAAGQVQADGLPGTAGQLGRLLVQDVNHSLRTGEAAGLFRLPLATKDGARNGPREFIIDTVQDGHPLTVWTGAFVTRILWQPGSVPPRAIGVEYVREGHVYQASLQSKTAVNPRQTVFAGKEVVLAAGAFNSPQLLMLSGVGDTDTLRSLDISPMLHRPGVGHNLQDRYEAAVVTEFDDDIALVSRCELYGEPASDPCLSDWQAGRGVYQTSGFVATVLRKSSSEVALPDLQTFAVPGDARGYYPGYSRDSLAEKNRFSWLLLKGHTQNRDGQVSLRSASPFERPHIQFNSFDEANPLGDPDLLAMVEGVKFVRDVIAQLQTQTPDVTEIWPGPSVVTDADIARLVRHEAWGHHACCSNKLSGASDATAVLDSQFRVIGAQGLRVVDASIFPEIPGSFIALPTFMISEKAADVILEAHR